MHFGFNPSPHLRTLPLGISWKHRRQPNIRQPQIELQDSIQSQPTSSVGRTPILECFRIMLESLSLRIQRQLSHPPAQRVVLIDPLGPTHHLLSTHEEVVAVGEFGVGGIGVRVEGANSERVFVDGVKVGLVLFKHDIP